MAFQLKQQKESSKQERGFKMGTELTGNPNIKLSKACSDKKYTVYTIGTTKQWVEFLVTKGGKIIILKQEKGTHPYFSPTKPKG